MGAWRTAMKCCKKLQGALDTANIPWQRRFAMKSAIVLRTEANRLRHLANRMDAFADEIEEEGQEKNNQRKFVVDHISDQVGSLSPGYYSGLTQSDAILKALEVGPQTTRELFNRLNSGGQSFKKPVYVTAVLGRLKDKTERTDDGKVKLKSNGS